MQHSMGGKRRSGTVRIIVLDIVMTVTTVYSYAFVSK